MAWEANSLWLSVLSTLLSGFTGDGPKDDNDTGIPIVTTFAMKGIMSSAKSTGGVDNTVQSEDLCGSIKRLFIISNQSYMLEK